MIEKSLCPKVKEIKQNDSLQLSDMFGPYFFALLGIVLSILYRFCVPEDDESRKTRELRVEQRRRSGRSRTLGIVSVLSRKSNDRISL